MVSVCCMCNPGDVLRPISTDNHSVKEFPFHIYQTWDISCCSLQSIPSKKQTNTIGPTYCKSWDRWNHPQLSVIHCNTSWVESASWLSFNPLWLVAYYIFLRTLHFLLLSSSPFPQHQVIAPHTPQPVVIEFKSSRTTSASLNAPLAETQQQCRNQWVQRDAAIAATKNITHDAHLKNKRETGRCNNMQQHAIGCE